MTVRDNELRIINDLIRANKQEEAESRFDALNALGKQSGYSAAYTSSKVLPALFDNDTKGDFLKKVWSLSIKECFITQLAMQKTDKYDTSLLLPICTSDRR